jgi:hypothetical protein
MHRYPRNWEVPREIGITKKIIYLGLSMYWKNKNEGV